jgi:DNA polymerase III subunit delta|tara:strand:+ start:1118 stop:2116 length:999 start_codon:yes stop_codon:yes gene_type:complete
MIIKQYILEQNPKAFLDYKIFLLYGENEGFKKEFKDKVKKIDKDFEILSFTQEEIVKNNNILFKEIENKSLFEKNKIFFIDQADDKILSIVEEVIESVQDEKIIIIAKNLVKKSKLRNFFEKEKNCCVTACYQDNETTLRNIILSSLKEYQGVTPEFINFIIENTGFERNKIRNEIEKVQSFFLNKIIDFKKVEQLLNIKTNDDYNKLKDEALNGNKNKTNRLLADTIFESENNVYYLNLINQRLNRLKDILNLKTNNTNIETIILNLKPPVFWKDKPILVKQLTKWNKEKIKIALKKTYEAELEMKSNSAIRKDIIIKNLIVELCASANAS